MYNTCTRASSLVLEIWAPLDYDTPMVWFDLVLGVSVGVLNSENQERERVEDELFGLNPVGLGKN